MIQFDDMREMERRASIHCGDGFLDIGLGVGLFLLGFAMIFGFAPLAVIYLAAAFSIVKAAKRSVTVPRMHHLDFMPDPDAESRAGRIRGVMRASVVVSIALGVCALLMSRIAPARISAALRSDGIVLFGMTLTGLFILVGWGTAVKRMRVYAAIAGSLFVFGYWFDLDVSWYLMIIGAVIGIWGAVVLVRFMRDYPKFHNRNGKVYQRTW